MSITGKCVCVCVCVERDGEIDVKAKGEILAERKVGEE